MTPTFIIYKLFLNDFANKFREGFTLRSIFYNCIMISYQYCKHFCLKHVKVNKSRCKHLLRISSRLSNSALFSFWFLHLSPSLLYFFQFFTWFLLDFFDFLWFFQFLPTIYTWPLRIFYPSNFITFKTLTLSWPDKDE